MVKQITANVPASISVSLNVVYPAREELDCGQIGCEEYEEIMIYPYGRNDPICGGWTFGCGGIGSELNADTAVGGATKASVLGSVPPKLRYHGCSSGLPDCGTGV
jgi:hypothetical protein